MFGIAHLVALELEEIVLVLLVGCFGRVTETQEAEAGKWMIKAEQASLLHRRLLLNAESDARKEISDAQTEIRSQLRQRGCAHVLDPALHQRLLSTEERESDTSAP